MNDIEIGRLSQISRRKHYEAGDTIISDAEPVDFFATIISGTVMLSKTLSDGRHQIVGLQFAPDFVGRAYSRNNTYTAEAATGVELCMFPKPAFERLTEEFPGLQHRLFEFTLDELDAAREWMLLLGRKTAVEKVASFLLMMARRNLMLGCSHTPQVDTAHFELPLTRAGIADFLGLTIETVSRQLTSLKTANVIRLGADRLVTVPDIARLASIAGQDL